MGTHYLKYDTYAAAIDGVQNHPRDVVNHFGLQIVKFKGIAMAHVVYMTVEGDIPAAGLPDFITIQKEEFTPPGDKDYSDLNTVDAMEMELNLESVAKAVGDLVPGHMFTLLLYSKEEPDRCNYISNAQRDGVIESLETTATRLRGEQ